MTNVDDRECLQAKHSPANGARAPRVAILVPCFNEATTVASVVFAFRDALPGAVVYVYDNNSTDGTAGLALEAGAIVRIERRQGKGFVLRRMFSDIEADCYIMVDGDGTYDPSAAPRLVNMVTVEGYDFVNVV